MRTLIAAAIMATAGIALPSPAAAEHGYTSLRLTLRYGPSVHYRPIIVIPDGRRVYVRRCTPRIRWCEIRYHRHIGWVPARYLIHDRYDRPYSYLGAYISLPLFDFFAHISDFDRDRRYRYRRYRYDDDWYRDLRRRHRRHDFDRERRRHYRRYRDRDDDDRNRRRFRHRRDRDDDGDRRRHRRHRNQDDGRDHRRGRHHRDSDRDDRRKRRRHRRDRDDDGKKRKGRRGRDRDRDEDDG